MLLLVVQRHTVRTINTRRSIPMGSNSLGGLFVLLNTKVTNELLKAAGR